MLKDLANYIPWLNHPNYAENDFIEQHLNKLPHFSFYIVQLSSQNNERELIRRIIVNGVLNKLWQLSLF